MSRLIVRFAFAVLLASALVAGGFWDKSPFLEWSYNQVLQLLTKSPWSAGTQATFGAAALAKLNETNFGAGQEYTPPPAGFVCVCQLDLGEGINRPVAESGEPTAFASDFLAGGRTTRRYMIRFITAKPIRMAIARHGVLSGRGDPKEALRFVSDSANPDAILVSISVLDGHPDELDLLAESLSENVYLRLRQSRRTIGATRYLSPSQTGQKEAIVFFPRILDRKPTITLQEKEATFVFSLAGVKIQRKFKLKDMVFKGQLEL